MTMERMTSVEVVVRDQVGAIASGLVPELIESFWTAPLGGPSKRQRAPDTCHS